MPPLNLKRNSDLDWELFAKIDPYYAVATKDQYHKSNLDDAVVVQFFESGKEQVDHVLQIIDAHLAPGFRPQRALDFGCGVGRLVVPLGTLCQSVVGVDVSISMLAEAKKNCDMHGISNVELILGDDELSRVPSGPFDFIISHVVLQHIPVKRGLRMAELLIDRLQEDGVGVLHFSYETEKSKVRRLIPWARKTIPFVHNIFNLIEGKQLSYPLMQGNRYPLNSILRLLQDKHCDSVYVRFTNYPGNYGVILFFKKMILGSI
jgi:ubiquinone/menaquinone biosynthesis C-methylase UbiE